MKTYLITFLLLMVVGISLYGQSPWQTVSASGVTLKYRVNAPGTNLECDLSGTTTGWIAVGFNPTDVMRNGNILIGYVSGGTPQIRDDWGTTSTVHVSDTSLGGVSNVTLVSGSETGGVTSLVFNIPLSSGDQYDRAMAIGQSYPIILARGANGADNYTGMHSGAGFANISITAPVDTVDPLAGPVIPTITGNYPNPFHTGTSIRYSLPKNADAGMVIYNQRGQKVLETKLDAMSKAGGEYIWNGKDSKGLQCPSGIYLVRIESSGHSSSKRMTLLR